MGSRASRWPRWRFILAMSGAWGVAWAIGFLLVYELDPAVGWTSVGLLGGLLSAMVLRGSGWCLVPGRLALAAGGWMAAGLGSAAIAKYEIVRGWMPLGILGGGLMALAMGRVSGGRLAVQMMLGSLGWVAAGLIGAEIQSTWGREVGTYVGVAVGGRATPFLIWSLAWGIGGSMAGAIGGGMLSVGQRGGEI